MIAFSTLPLSASLCTKTQETYVDTDLVQGKHQALATCTFADMVIRKLPVCPMLIYRRKAAGRVTVGRAKQIPVGEAHDGQPAAEDQVAPRSQDNPVLSTLRLLLQDTAVSRT
nr:hypothetical protein L203_00968 [Cryptococcus depauperatus CBS 7841]